MTLRTNLYLLCLLLIAGSCTTILNRKVMTINIYTDIDSATVYINNIAKAYTTPAKVVVPRGEGDLYLTIKNDSLEKTVRVREYTSPLYWGGNSFTPYGIGCLIDLTNRKRMTYNHYNYIPLKEPQDRMRPYRWVPAQKKQVNIKIGLPMINLFYTNPLDEAYQYMTGGLGFSTGLEYYLTDHYALNMDFGVMASLTDVGEGFYYYSYNLNEEVPSSLYAYYTGLQAGRDFKYFHVDAGLQYTQVQNHYYGNDYVHKLIKYNNAGLALSGYVKVTEFFNMGGGYYPSLLSISRQKGIEPQYNHLISFDMVFKFAIRPNNKRATFRPLINNDDYYIY